LAVGIEQRVPGHNLRVEILVSRRKPKKCHSKTKNVIRASDGGSKTCPAVGIAPLALDGMMLDCANHKRDD
jgi:hypothetical protein